MKKRVQNNSEGVRHVNYSKSRAQTQAAIEAEKSYSSTRQTTGRAKRKTDPVK